MTNAMTLLNNLSANAQVEIAILALAAGCFVRMCIKARFGR